MTYNNLEFSAQDGKPAYRLLFEVGGTEYKYTTEQHIVDGYIPAPVEIGEFNQTSEIAKATLDIKFPRDNPFALLFRGGVPEQQTKVTVLRYHIGDGEFRFYWKGRVMSAKFDGDVLEVVCNNIFASLKRSGDYQRYQRTCRHALYMTGCGVDKSAFAVAASAITIANRTLTFADLSGQPAGYFAGGMVEYSGAFRHVVSQSGNAVEIIRPFPSLSDAIDAGGATAVTLYPGCDHTRETCVAKFNNVLNFGGFPWMPGKNPFSNNVTGSIA